MHKLLLGLTILAAAPTFAQIDLRLTQVADIGNVVDIKHAGDGSGRLFVVTQIGEIFVVDDESVLDEPLLSLRGQVTVGGEQGLLTMDFPPDFAQTQRFYVYYTDTFGRGTLSRFTMRADGAAANPDSEEILLTVAQPFPNHNGGRIEFGPDGMLYLGLGDGGAGGDPDGNAQNMATLLGKIIRLDVSADQGYDIPSDNPFVNDPNVRDEIWASGLRNPWKMAFDGATGDLYIADVGQQALEEINRQPAGMGGLNYGWDRFEGSQCFEGACNTAGLTFPVFEYGHDLGCSITGGQVYRGASYPALHGLYLYGDFCGGQIWGLAADGGQATNTLLLDTELAITTFGEDEFGNVYVASGGGVGFRKGVSRGVFLISDGDPVAASQPFVAGHSGTYTVDGFSDQGFFVTIDENDQGPFIFFAWFTFRDGLPYWLVGVEFFADGDGQVAVPVSTRNGPGFLDPDTTPATVTLGTITLTARSCNELAADYQIDGFSSGSLTLTKLTGIRGLGCE